MISEDPLVSIIMPAFNAERHIHEAIQSVIDQQYANWELLIINDGSTDNTLSILDDFIDSRIKVFSQSNKGVSAARNVGLANLQGAYVCFFDSDDVLPANSLKDRVDFFLRHPNVDFVDGTVFITDGALKTTHAWHPSFRGQPQQELVRIKESCFVTISWMVRTQVIEQVRFVEGLSHGEDLVFFTEVSPGLNYDFVSTPTLYFRRSGYSAMSNFTGLANGYRNMYRIFLQKNLFLSVTDRLICKMKITKIMILTFVKAGKYRDAFDFAIKFTWA
jgi:glycosyltransferase involved in cell wall biosynthesis